MAGMPTAKGIGGHHRGHRGRSDTWLTPPHVLAALGPFDLDPACPPDMPWPTAARMLTPADNGLGSPWVGRVYLNPPYGPDTATWLELMADHGNGIALTFARTETEMFHRFVWERAAGLLFLKGRLHFHHADGTRAKANAGGPSVLIAYGSANAGTLWRCGLAGRYVALGG
jgi:hypothetical protein